MKQNRWGCVGRGFQEKRTSAKALKWEHNKEGNRNRRVMEESDEHREEMRPRLWRAMHKKP